MTHRVQVLTSISIETWIEVAGSPDPDHAAKQAEEYAKSAAIAKYNLTEEPTVDAMGCRHVPDEEGAPVVPGCKEIPNPVPKAPPPPPKPEPSPEQAAADAPPQTEIPDGACVVDEQFLLTLMRLHRATQEFMLDDDTSAMEELLAQLEQHQFNVPPPAHLTMAVA